MKSMGGFDGITYSHSISGGMVSVRLTQHEFEKFQAKQGSNVSIGECENVCLLGAMPNTQ